MTVTTKANTAKVEVTLINKHGIHVRTAALISDLCGSFESEILIKSSTAMSDGTDMMRLLLLQAGYDTKLIVEASGVDAQEAVIAIQKLISTGFDLEDEIVD